VRDPITVNFRSRIFALLLLAGMTPLCGARQHVPAKLKATETGYVQALAIANRFLNAWQTGDLETGMFLLSDRARRSQTAESLENLFSRSSDRAFEINRGKSDRGRYRFPVMMISGENSHIHRKFSEIILISTGKNEWAVDQLP
jgi:hypothetical protein